MSRKLSSIAAAALAVVTTSAAQAQVVNHRDVGAHMALKIIEAAVAKCEQNKDGLTVAVVDRAGRLRGMVTADRAARITPNSPSARPIRR